MKLEQIQQYISQYNDLIELTEKKLKILEQNDIIYCTFNSIDKITFEDDLVHVTYDIYHRGSWEQEYFSFPIEWLSIESDSELAEVVLKAKTEREQKKLDIKKKLEEKLKKETEEKEIKEFLKLKEKYRDIHGI